MFSSNKADPQLNTFKKQPNGVTERQLERGASFPIALSLCAAACCFSALLCMSVINLYHALKVKVDASYIQTVLEKQEELRN